MSNNNINLQTQTSSALHNAIIEAGGIDRPPMLAPVPPATPDIDGTLPQPREEIILTGIDNDIYSTVDACSNAMDMWKLIERLKQGKSINLQDLENNLYWEFRKFTSRDGETLDSYDSRFYKMITELARNLCDVSNHKKSTNLPTTTSELHQTPGTSTLILLQDLTEELGTQVVQQTRIQCYNYKEFGHVARECKKAKWRDDTDDEPEDQELKAHYIYMEKIQEVIPDVTNNSGPIFDHELLQKDDQMFQEERELLASLIEQMKIKIDGSKQNKKSLESSNKALREANTFLNSELKRYKDSDFMEGAILKCAKAYGIFEEQKVTSEKEYYYADHMNAILGIYTNLDEYSEIPCKYLEALEKCERLEKELSKQMKM
ncbi:hypothetical protein Tco_1216410 [Tanacetum coccineum]